MYVVSEHQICGVSGRGYREFQGEKYWYWPTRSIYGSQVGGKTRLLHLEIYKAIHGSVDIRSKPYPVDGNVSNTDPSNWVVTRSVRNRKHPVQEFDGVRFYWKPEGYYKSEHYKFGGTTMHRYVWEFHNGAIPDGFHIHHKDENKANNSIENLEMLSASEHTSHHSSSSEWVGSDENKAQILAAGELAKEWHASEDGRDWHSEHAVKSWEGREWHKVNCIECGKEFFTPYPTRAKYCHANCKATALRRRRGEAVGVRPDRRKTPLLSSKRTTGK